MTTIIKDFDEAILLPDGACLISEYSLPLKNKTLHRLSLLDSSHLLFYESEEYKMYFGGILIDIFNTNN